jgi:hypothetical protein
MSTLRLHAEHLGQLAIDSPGERNELKTSAVRRRRSDGADKRTAAARGDAPAPREAAGESLRPAALRAIDEGDPYK